MFKRVLNSDVLFATSGLSVTEPFFGSTFTHPFPLGRSVEISRVMFPIANGLEVDADAY